MNYLEKYNSLIRTFAFHNFFLKKNQRRNMYNIIGQLKGKGCKSWKQKSNNHPLIPFSIIYLFI